MKRQCVFVLCFAMLMPSDFDSSSGHATLRTKDVTSRCLTEDQLAKAVISLSRDYNEAGVAQRLLRQSSSRSSVCRKRVIAAVMNAMDRSDLDIRRYQAHANLWREGAVLLGDLKASQALDLLLSHIKMTDGEWSVTMTHQPALEGIIRMGTLAIPKLESLLQSADWETRHFAVYCLFSIGGSSARRALERALPKETDRCVKPFMSISLKTMREGGNKPLSATKSQRKLVSAFWCDHEE